MGLMINRVYVVTPPNGINMKKPARHYHRQTAEKPKLEKNDTLHIEELFV